MRSRALITQLLNPKIYSLCNFREPLSNNCRSLSACRRRRTRTLQTQKTKPLSEPSPFSYEPRCDCSFSAADFKQNRRFRFFSPHERERCIERERCTRGRKSSYSSRTGCVNCCKTVALLRPCNARFCDSKNSYHVL